MIFNYQFKNRKIHLSIYQACRLVHRALSILNFNGISTKVCDRPTRKYISDDCGIIYFKNPLVGSQSILKIFNNSTSLSDHKKKRVYTYLVHDHFDLQKYPYTFTVVRNPWNRIASFYNKKILNANSIARIGLISQYKDLYPGMKFSKMISAILDIPYSQSDPHWRPQSFNVLSRNSPKYIIRFEDLSQSLPRLLSMAGVKYDSIPRTGSSESQLFSPYSKVKLFSSLSDRSIDLLNQYYLVDRICFGYENLHKYLRSLRDRTTNNYN